MDGSISGRLVHVFSGFCFLCVLFFNFSPTFAQEQQEKKKWTGKFANGTVITESALRRIIEKHQKWVHTNEKEGEQAFLDKADLSGVNLSGVNLSRVFLTSVDLSGANLSRANLSKAVLVGADLSSADLTKANMADSFLINANLSKAFLYFTNLHNAKLDRADLREAHCSNADLSNASLYWTDLDGTEIFETDFRFAVYEPKPGTLPVIPYLATVKNFYLVRYLRSPHGLMELRGAVRKAGLRQLEREITYAINHTMALKALKGGIIDKIGEAFKFVMFDLTCQYGMSPSRSLIVLILLVPIFAIPYTISIIAKRNKGVDGIYQIWLPDRVRQDLGEDKPVRVNLPGLKALLMGLYFSLLSAFSIGWRDLNVGNWIARIQPLEYTLRATGWVRTVSGVQSLISVCLLAFWVLTYFGRPFG